MSMLYCFELPYIKQALGKYKPHGLAVIDTDGISRHEINYACTRGVWVYRYINSGAI